jgi:MFS family permease
VLAALYAATGLGSGATNVPVMGLVARWFHGSVRGRAAGFVASGSGFAIILAGRLIPSVNRTRGVEGWRTSWVILGSVVCAIGLLAGLLLRNRPEEAGHAPFGEPAARTHASPLAPAASSTRDLLRSRTIHVLGAVYALFGFTYAIYVTFIVTALVRERGLGEGAAGEFWAMVGLLSLLSGPVFGTLSDRLGRRTALALVFGLQAVAYLVAGAAWLPPSFLYLSIGCFGIAAWSIPSIMLAAVSDEVGPDRALGAYGVLTFFFWVGQIAGPALAGVVAERTGSFSSSFFLAGALAAFAMAVSAVGLRARARTSAAADLAT